MKDRHEQQPAGNHQWWLTEGPESCSVCEASTHPEMLGFCMVCDRGVCYLCFEGVEPTEPVVCPECAETLARERTKE